VLYSILETRRQPSLGGCSALTSEGANKLINQLIMTVSAISPSTRRIATTLVRAIPIACRRYSNRLFWGVIRSTHHAGRIKQELCVQRFFVGSTAKRTTRHVAMERCHPSSSARRVSAQSTRNGPSNSDNAKDGEYVCQHGIQTCRER